MPDSDPLILPELIRSIVPTVDPVTEKVTFGDIEIANMTSGNVAVRLKKTAKDQAIWIATVTPPAEMPLGKNTPRELHLGGANDLMRVFGVLSSWLGAENAAVAMKNLLIAYGSSILKTAGL